jgi:hypothetical protein
VNPRGTERVVAQNFSKVLGPEPASSPQFQDGFTWQNVEGVAEGRGPRRDVSRIVRRNRAFGVAEFLRMEWIPKLGLDFYQAVIVKRISQVGS